MHSPRPLAKRRGGDVAVTGGFIAVAVSAVALLASGPRLLGVDAFSGLALSWTIATVFGFGISTPTEQLLSRRLNAGLNAHTTRPLIALVALTLISAIGVTVVGPSLPPVASFPELVPASLAAILGWATTSVARGKLAGSGDLRAYATVLVVEAVSRLALVLWAWRDRPASPVLLGAAVGLPLVVSASAGFLFRTERLKAAAGGSDPRPASSEQMSFVVAALGYQLCLNGPPLLLAWRIGPSDPAFVGAFVASNALFRSPTVLIGGTSVRALVDLSRDWSTGDFLTFRTDLRRAMSRVVGIGLSTSLLCLISAPLALPLLYGHDPGLPWQLYFGLAASTILTVVGVIASTTLMAVDRAGSAALTWGIGGCLTVLSVLIAASDSSWLAIALVVGPAATLCSAGYLALQSTSDVRRVAFVSR